MSERMNLVIDGMGCQSCVAAVRSALEGVPGVQVEDVAVGSAVVRFEDEAAARPDDVLAAVRAAGYVPAAGESGD